MSHNRGSWCLRSDRHGHNLPQVWLLQAADLVGLCSFPEAGRRGSHPSWLIACPPSGQHLTPLHPLSFKETQEPRMTGHTEIPNLPHCQVLCPRGLWGLGGRHSAIMSGVKGLNVSLMKILTAMKGF